MGVTRATNNTQTRDRRYAPSGSLPVKRTQAQLAGGQFRSFLGIPTTPGSCWVVPSCSARFRRLPPRAARCRAGPATAALRPWQPETIGPVSPAQGRPGILVLSKLKGTEHKGIRGGGHQTGGRPPGPGEAQCRRYFPGKGAHAVVLLWHLLCPSWGLGSALLFAL